MGRVDDWVERMSADSFWTKAPVRQRRKWAVLSGLSSLVFGGGTGAVMANSLRSTFPLWISATLVVGSWAYFWGLTRDPASATKVFLRVLVGLAITGLVAYIAFLFWIWAIGASRGA